MATAIDFRAQNDAAQDALAFAATLSSEPHVQEVLFFGSVARGTATYDSDIDVVLVVEESLYQAWVLDMRNMLPSDTSVYYGTSAARYAELWRYIHRPDGLPYLHDRLFDVFLLPQGYASRIDELQSDLPHDDPDFTRNIVREFVDANELRMRCREDMCYM